jgi:hypothetical protein
MFKEIASKAFRLITPVVLGASAAVLTTVLMDRAEEGAAPAAAAGQKPLDPPAGASRTRIESAPNGKIGELERRLAELEASREARVERAGAPTSEPPGTPPIPDPEETARELSALNDMLLAKHAGEPVDPTWSSGAVSAFQRDFAALTEQREAKVVGVECKTTSCVATLEWPSYEAAQREHSEVVMHGYEVNCRRQIWAPEPEDREARYKATAIFDCSGRLERPN